MGLRKRLQIILDRRVKSVINRYSSWEEDPFLGEIKTINSKGIILCYHFENKVNRILQGHFLEPIKSKHIPRTNKSKGYM